MTDDSAFHPPYRRHWIHAFYDWLDRLPIPGWLSLVLILPLVGLAQNLVAWMRGMLEWGTFNADLATAGIYLAAFIGLYFMLRLAPRPVDEFRPLLDVTDEEFETLKYRFTTLPSLGGNVAFLIMAVLSFMLGLADKAVAPAVDYAFAAMRLGIWFMGGGSGGLMILLIIRQLRQIGVFYAMPERIDLFKQRPLHGFARYAGLLAVVFVFVYGLQVVDPDPSQAMGIQLALPIYAIIVVLILIAFYVPLSGAHRRLVGEKERLLGDVEARIETILDRFHVAAFEDEDFSEVGGMRTVLSTLREEKETLEAMSTWPWRRGTLGGVFSALALPVLLAVLREFAVGILGL